jgi:hypothetical protein
MAWSAHHRARATVRGRHTFLLPDRIVHITDTVLFHSEECTLQSGKLLVQTPFRHLAPGLPSLLEGSIHNRRVQRDRRDAELHQCPSGSLERAERQVSGPFGYFGLVTHFILKRSRLDEIISGIFEKHTELDMSRLKSIIQMKIFEIKDKVRSFTSVAVSLLHF